MVLARPPDCGCERLTFGIWEYGSDKWGNWGLVASWKFWNALVFRSLAERWFTWAGFPLVIIGLVLRRRTQGERLFDWWLIAVLVYVIIVARGNFVYEYYQLPFLPVGAVFIGKVFARFWGQGARPAVRAALAGCLIATAILSAARLADYLRREAPARCILASRLYMDESGFLLRLEDDVIPEARRD